MPYTDHTPTYRRHRASGQAVVTIGGVDHYLGTYGSKASHTEYDHLLGEWLAPSSPAPAETLTPAARAEFYKEQFSREMASKDFAAPSPASAGGAA